MPTNFPAPDRCLLVQAAHWFIYGTMPIPDDVYRRAPVELKADNSELRELFLALYAEDCDVRGELEVEYTKKLGPYEEEFDYSPPMSLLREANISTIGVLKDIDFAESLIKTKSWKVAEIADEQIEKKRQSFPSDDGWREELFFKNVTVDFSKLRTVLAAEKEDTQQPAKRGAPPKYNWDLIWAELAVRADLDGLPKSQAECIRDISQWCIDLFDEAPSETTLKAKLKYIYGHHRKAGK